MYEDSTWYNTFMSSSKPQQKHRRRVSLLKQPDEEEAAESSAHEDIPTIREDSPRRRRTSSPPPVILSRRAQSYSDFYHAAQQELQKENLNQKSKASAKRQHQRRASQVEDEHLYDFDQWYTQLADDLLDTSHDQYRVHLEQLENTRRHLDSLLEDTEANLQLLSHLSTSFHEVDTRSSAFRGRCEDLLSEQQRVASLADDISHNLQYYQHLEPITRRLNAPGVRHFVRSDDFASMLAQLDECLEYMHSHPNQREASTYASRYKQLLTRGLTLIRVHFTDTLRETAADVSKRIADRQLNDTTMPALLYAKFRVGAPELKQLGREIHKRAVPPKDAEPGTQGEYQSLVNELHQSYSAARGRLIIPLTSKKMNEIALAPSSATDLVAFARSSISYTRGICLDESQLWHEWFDGDDGLYEFLEALCEPLYDYLRPRIIRETRLPKLCELCSLLQVGYIDAPEEDEDENEEGVLTAYTQHLDFGSLIRTALEDTQTRLVFLTMSVLRSDIEKFKPKPEHLNYPVRNRVPLSGKKANAPVLSGKKRSTPQEPPQMAAKSPTEAAKGESDEVLDDLQWGMSHKEAFEGWYPTLQKAIWLLSKIYRLVHSSVFDDLAHQIVHQTTLSLVSASASLKARPDTHPLDSPLFLLTQLLTLKQQIVAFDIEFVTPDITVDFSSLASTFWELRERGGLFNPASWVRLVGSGMMPRVIENMLDAKAELDARLRVVIGEFTNGAADRLTTSISESAMRAAGFDAAKSVSQLRQNVEAEAPVVRRKLDDYLEDVRTKETLAGAVHDQCVSHYEDFYERYLLRAQDEGTPMSPKGKAPEGGVWDPDVFADWSAEIFGVSVDGGFEADTGYEGPGTRSGDEGANGLGSSPGTSRPGSV